MKNPSMTSARPSWILPAGIFWLCALGGGFFFLLAEQYTPLPSSSAKNIFPETSSIVRGGDQPALLFFAHPHCPCTRASLHELNRLVRSTGGHTPLHVIFVLPEGVPAGWEKGELLDYAATIPGARIFLDRDGAESKRFAVPGSGLTLLYGNKGRLLFQGGLTPSRGHEGKSPGQAALRDLLLSGQAPIQSSPAYGCPLLPEKKKGQIL